MYHRNGVLSMPRLILSALPPFILLSQSTGITRKGSARLPFLKYYSVLSATTGSFFAALREGMIPEMSVSSMLMHTSITAAPIGR